MRTREKAKVKIPKKDDFYVFLRLVVLRSQHSVLYKIKNYGDHSNTRHCFKGV